ncbi:MAG: DUF3795 domain-containing protein [Planctomycetes bacterium]|jgi:hypothetical protein|nr:DUF3795 domain-containing protein [Planctomycetota bacterium]
MGKRNRDNTGIKSEQERLIGYCGLYCGDCSGYQGTIANLARDLHQELERERFADLAKVLSKIPFFKAFKDFPKCCAVLQTLPKLRCRKTCRGNGGPPLCQIRECCREKRFEGCWQCEGFKTCSKLAFLQAGHGDAHLRNLAKIRRSGPSAFLAGKRYWRTTPRRR